MIKFLTLIVLFTYSLSLEAKKDIKLEIVDGKIYLFDKKIHQSNFSTILKYLKKTSETTIKEGFENHTFRYYINGETLFFAFLDEEYKIYSIDIISRTIPVKTKIGKIRVGDFLFKVLLLYEIEEIYLDHTVGRIFLIKGINNTSFYTSCGYSDTLNENVDKEFFMNNKNKCKIEKIILTRY